MINVSNLKPFVKIIAAAGSWALSDYITKDNFTSEAGIVENKAPEAPEAPEAPKATDASASKGTTTSGTNPATPTAPTTPSKADVAKAEANEKSSLLGFLVAKLPEGVKKYVSKVVSPLNLLINTLFKAVAAYLAYDVVKETVFKSVQQPVVVSYTPDATAKVVSQTSNLNR